MREVVFHPLVGRDVRGSVRYYEEASGASLAEEFLSELDRLLETIAKAPQIFHPIGGGARRANLRRFPYHLVFVERRKDVFIVALRHHKRRPGFGLSRRFTP